MIVFLETADNQLNEIPIETLHTILLELENLYSNQSENLEQIYNKLFKGILLIIFFVRIFF